MCSKIPSSGNWRDGEEEGGNPIAGTYSTANVHASPIIVAGYTRIPPRISTRNRERTVSLSLCLSRAPFPLSKGKNSEREREREDRRSASAARPLMFSAISDNGGLWRV